MHKPAWKSAGFLLLALACIGEAGAQTIPLRLNRAPATPASPSATAPASPDEAHAGAVDASTDYVARMDADRDGRVSLAEYQDWLSYAFTRMDADRDGVLASSELPGGRGKPVSLADHRQTVAERFARQDRNRDGYLDAQELLAPPQ
ncbi:calcium-dependent protein kinase 21 [Lysobacter arvi]|uniref:calcium-dependent protein kinase 21 n=1 Tax=Lysobacter arvi TaxID=3038776 RepID=UPI00283A9FBA|nr:calcium-dependent protein kinase 21 [Lysobacter arvi]